MTPEELSTRLREAIATRGISIRELGRRIGMNGSYLAKVFRGESSPTVTTLTKIAHGLNMSVPELIAGNTPRLRPASLAKRDREIERLKQKIASMEEQLVKAKLLSPF